MPERGIDELENLAMVFEGVYRTPRLAVLLGLYEGEDVGEIVEQLDISRPGLQRNIDAMVEAELVYRPSEDGPYALTPLGEDLAEWVDEKADEILDVLEEVEEEEEKVREEVRLGDLPIDEREVERAVHTRKWENLLDRD